MLAAALPAARIVRRPAAGGSGRYAGRHRLGCTALIAAKKIFSSVRRSSARASIGKIRGSGGKCRYGKRALASLPCRKENDRSAAMTQPEKTFDRNAWTELEAAAFRRLVEHLRTREDVQN